MHAPNRVVTSAQLLRSSMRVIKDQPKLLFFLFVNGALMVLLALCFVPWPLVLHLVQAWRATGAADHWDETVAQLNHTTVYLYLIALYLISMFAATFLNVALHHEIFRALDSEKVSLLQGLRFAAGRLRSIILWSLFASSVGLVLQLVASRTSWLGALAARLLGMAWSVAAVFALPALVRDEPTDPLTLLRHSALTLQNTWGESILGYIGVQGVELLTFFCLAGVGLLAAFVLSTIFSWPLFFVSIPFIILTLCACAWVTSLANRVYRCALYIYATEGVVPEPFTSAMMEAAWKVQKN